MNTFGISRFFLCSLGSFRVSRQEYQCLQPGAVIYPCGALSTWAVLCSLVPDGLGLAVRQGQARFESKYRVTMALNKVKRLRHNVKTLNGLDSSRKPQKTFPVNQNLN